MAQRNRTTKQHGKGHTGYQHQGRQAGGRFGSGRAPLGDRIAAKLMGAAAVGVAGIVLVSGFSGGGSQVAANGAGGAEAQAPAATVVRDVNGQAVPTPLNSPEGIKFLNQKVRAAHMTQAQLDLLEAQPAAVRQVFAQRMATGNYQRVVVTRSASKAARCMATPASGPSTLCMALPR